MVIFLRGCFVSQKNIFIFSVVILVIENSFSNNNPLVKQNKQTHTHSNKNFIKEHSKAIRIFCWFLGVINGNNYCATTNPFFVNLMHVPNSQDVAFIDNFDKDSGKSPFFLESSAKTSQKAWETINTKRIVKKYLARFKALECKESTV